jgi:spore maturation protein CgeB
MKPMKILVAGDWRSELHEEPVYLAFQKLGHETRRFAWHEYFRPLSNGAMPNIFDSVNRKFQNKYLIGPRISKLNHDLVSLVNEYHPHILFIYRGTHINRTALHEIKRDHPGTILVGYNNDDPFSKAYPSWKWRHFLKAVPKYDLLLAYRQHNLAEFERAGAKQVRLLRSWFVPELNHPVCLSQEDRARFECDVVFVGHYEPDGRLNLLEAIVRQGYRLRLFGPGRGFRWQGWYPWVEKSQVLKHLAPINLVLGEEYNKALCGANVALCCLSKLNRDTYTRRCFEIPAAGTLMLSEYSDDLATLYREGNETDFFRNQNELMCKLKRYLGDDQLRMRVAQGGYKRVFTDGHDVVSRMQQVLRWVSELREEKYG